MAKNISMFKRAIALSIAAAFFTHCSTETPPVDRSILTEAQKRLPEYAVSGLEVADGLEATLFAAEPMIMNPTNIDVDPRGRVWVCEAFNYRSELNPGNEVDAKGDKIVILEDTNGDGKADSRKIFYQGTDINAALGIGVFGNKVIVSCSPNVFIFTDEDGDDVPDKKEVLFTGLGGVQHDHAIHSFTFGPDGKFYFNFGNAGDQLLDKDGNPIVDMVGNEVNGSGNPYRQGMLFRCDTDGSNMEVLGFNFRNNYEPAVDSYGSIWQSDNDDDGNRGVRINFILEYGNYGFTDEFTGASWSTRRTNMEKEIPLRHWHQNDPGSVPNLLQTGAGSPTGMIVYEGDLLPERFRNQMIHTDAGPNVVRAYPVEKKGAGYTASIVNILKGNDDPWFRPSDVCVAPDGSLFVADWYDPGVGGHQMGDQAQGRIYRVAPKGVDYEAEKVNVSSAEAAVKSLQSPNMGTRYLAWTALEAMGSEAEAALKGLLNSSNPRMKARALWLLARIDGKTDEYIQLATSDPDENIRLTGLKIARSLQVKNLDDYLAKAASDKSPQVRREVAIAVRYLDSPKAVDIWTDLALQYNGKDRWYLEALGIGADPRGEEFFKNWIEKGGLEKPGANDIVWRSRAKSALPMLAKLATNGEGSMHDNLRYFRAFDFHKDPSKDNLLASMLTIKHPQQDSIKILALSHISPEKINSDPAVNKIMRGSLAQMKGTPTYMDWVKRYQLRDQVPSLVSIYTQSPKSEFGPEAIKLVHQFEGIDFFKKQLQQKDNEKVIETLNAMTNLWGPEVWNTFKEISLDESRDLAVRKAAIKAYGTGWSTENNLLDMALANEVPEELKETAMYTLLNGIKSSVRKEAAKMLAAGDTKFGSIEELVALDGSATNGAAMFERVCSTCHVVNNKGTQFGPQLSEIGDKLGKEGLYKAIMYPDAGISFGYEGFLITTAAGEKIAGYISSETNDALEVTVIGGAKTRYAKKDIVSKEPLENSLMPTGLHNAFTQQELVDLVAYLSSLKNGAPVAAR
ncbi:MAG: PVC-type heme-binding CxxCH protein [Imperialibacter sp.]|uniref:PVC-type heme-binding CxxCH protein n=1 Tax=Imperialibacter sp. TaxID=2038411 RepID=UPI003A84EB71